MRSKLPQCTAAFADSFASLVIVCLQMSYETHVAAEEEMQRMLNEAYSEVQGMLARNRAALDALIEALIQSPEQNITGPEVRDIIRQRGHPADVQHKEANTTAFA